MADYKQKQNQFDEIARAMGQQASGEPLGETAAPPPEEVPPPAEEPSTPGEDAEETEEVELELEPEQEEEAPSDEAPVEEVSPALETEPAAEVSSAPPTTEVEPPPLPPEVSTKVNELEQQLNTYKAQEQQLTQQIENYAGAVKDLIVEDISPPDMALREEDPFEYDKQMATYIHQRHLNEQAGKKLQEAQIELKTRKDAEYQDFIKRESAEMRRWIPALADPDKGRQVSEDLMSYARSRGVTEDQLAWLTGSMASILYDGLRFQQARANMKKVGKKTTKVPKSAAPGTSKAPPVGKEADTVTKKVYEDHLKKPSQKSLAGLFTHAIEQGG